MIIEFLTKSKLYVNLNIYIILTSLILPITAPPLPSSRPAWSAGTRSKISSGEPPGKPLRQWVIQTLTRRSKIKWLTWLKYKLPSLPSFDFPIFYCHPHSTYLEYCGCYLVHQIRYVIQTACNQQHAEIAGYSWTIELNIMFFKSLKVSRRSALKNLKAYILFFPGIFSRSAKSMPRAEGLLEHTFKMICSKHYINIIKT